jgi:hypothetical protein
MLKKALFVASSAAALISYAPYALAAPVSLAEGWKNQRLSLFSKNDYDFGQSLKIASNGAVSIAWRKLPRIFWEAERAAWHWSVSQSVPATDLSVKGGDDRNISIYFLFAPNDQAEKLAGADIRSLLGNDDLRVIQYAWGGNHDRGALLQSPYQPGQGVTVALRPASTGSHSESVNLSNDFRKAFGNASGKLLWIAVSGDSDDTDSTIRAQISNFQID